MKIAIYTLTSPLHDAQAIDTETRDFIEKLSITDYELITDNEFKDYGTHALDLIYVRTGGTEAVFRDALPALKQATHRPCYLLTSGQSN